MRPFQNFGKMAADKKHFEPKFCLFKPFLEICQLSQRQTLQAWFKGRFQGLTRLLNSCSSHSEIPKNHSDFNMQVSQKAPYDTLPNTNKKSLHNFMCYRGLGLSIRQNQIKGGISRLAKSRKPQFTAVNEDLRDKHNAEITLLSILKGQ